MPQSNTIPRLEPQLRRVTTPDAGERLELSGPWILRALEERMAEYVRQLSEHARDENRHWDLSGVTRLDHAGAMLLWRAWGGQRAARLTLRPEHEALFAGLSVHRQRPAAPGRDWREPFAVLGDQVVGFRDHVLQFVQLVGQIVIDTARVLRDPREVPWRVI